jgi:hypothetical protein
MNQGRPFHGPARDRFDLCFSTLVTRRELLAGKGPGGLLEGKLVVVQVKLIWKTPVSPPSSDHPKR